MLLAQECCSQRISETIHCHIIRYALPNLELQAERRWSVEGGAKSGNGHKLWPGGVRARIMRVDERCSLFFPNEPQSQDRGRKFAMVQKSLVHSTKGNVSIRVMVPFLDCLNGYLRLQATRFNVQYELVPSIFGGQNQRGIHQAFLYYYATTPTTA